MGQQNIFPYPGSKGRLADWVVSHIPTHDCYVEPFGGSAAVLFEKPSSSVEVYNDADGTVSTFFKTLRDNPDGLAEWLADVPYCRETHREFNARLYGDGGRPDDDLEVAGMFFYLRYASFAGKRGDSFKRPRPDEQSGGWRDFASSYQNAVDDLHNFASRFRGVTIESDDYSAVLDAYGSETTFFYCDPPYRDSGGYYAGEFDWDEFTEQLLQLDGRWLVSCVSLPDQLEEFHVVEREAYHSIGNDNGQKEATEKLIMNYDPRKTPTFAGKTQTRLTEVAD